MHRLSDRVRKYTRKDKRNEINTSNMAAEAYARRTAKFNDFKRDGIFRNHSLDRENPVALEIIELRCATGFSGTTVWTESMIVRERTLGSIDPRHSSRM